MHLCWLFLVTFFFPDLVFFGPVSTIPELFSLDSQKFPRINQWRRREEGSPNWYRKRGVCLGERYEYSCHLIWSTKTTQFVSLWKCWDVVWGEKTIRKLRSNLLESEKRGASSSLSISSYINCCFLHSSMLWTVDIVLDQRPVWLYKNEFNKIQDRYNRNSIYHPPLMRIRTLLVMYGLYVFVLSINIIISSGSLLLSLLGTSLLLHTATTAYLAPASSSFNSSYFLPLTQVWWVLASFLE